MLSVIKEHLRDSPVQVLSDLQTPRASVAIIIIVSLISLEPHVLLIQRSHRPGDRWSEQVRKIKIWGLIQVYFISKLAFPGGGGDDIETLVEHDQGFRVFNNHQRSNVDGTEWCDRK